MRELGDDHLEFDREAEAAGAVRPDLHARADRAVVDLDLLRPRDGLQSGVEACGISGREELLGVGPVAAAAHLLGDGEIELDATVVRGDVSVAAGAGGEGFCGVEGFH